MKKIVIELLLLLVVVSSCDVNSIEPEETNEFITKYDVDFTTKKLVNNFILKNDIKSNISKIDSKVLNFDYSEMKLIKSNGLEFIIMYENDYSDSNDNNSLLSFQKSGNEIVGANITEVTRISKDLMEVYTYGLDGEIIFSYEIDVKSNKINSIDKGNFNSRTECGQATMNCINSAYSNFGWASVALWVGTVLDPAIGLGVAAGCAIGCAVS
ncbi:MAG TPA: hypothetical protein PKL31_08745 [Fulvivirga sp.]|nr:hypothetical protein [Fulvivirga sp.]